MKPVLDTIEIHPALASVAPRGNLKNSIQMVKLLAVEYSLDKIVDHEHVFKTILQK